MKTAIILTSEEKKRILENVKKKAQVDLKLARVAKITFEKLNK